MPSSLALAWMFNGNVVHGSGPDVASISSPMANYLIHNVCCCMWYVVKLDLRPCTTVRTQIHYSVFGKYQNLMQLCPKAHWKCIAYMWGRIHCLIDRVYLRIGLLRTERGRHLPLHHIISTQSNKMILIIILSIYWWQQTAERERERGWDDAKIAGRQNWNNVGLFHFSIIRLNVQLILVFSAMLTILLSIHHFDNNRSVHFYFH